MTNFNNYIGSLWGQSKKDFQDLTNGKLPSRKNDPETSKLAAKKHELRAGSNAKRIYEYVKQFPDSTAGELGEMTKLGQHETARRLSDLCRKGFIVKGESKLCSIKNSLMTAWRANGTH
jgi:predicted HTH transcriptional regulator